MIAHFERLYFGVTGSVALSFLRHDRDHEQPVLSDEYPPYTSDLSAASYCAPSPWNTHVSQHSSCGSFLVRLTRTLSVVARDGFVFTTAGITSPRVSRGSSRASFKNDASRSRQDSAGNAERVLAKMLGRSLLALLPLVGTGTFLPLFRKLFPALTRHGSKRSRKVLLLTRTLRTASSSSDTPTLSMK